MDKKEYKKQYYQKNKAEIKARSAAYSKKHPNEIRDYNKLYYEQNKNKIKERSTMWHKNNKEAVRIIRNKYKRKKYQSDILYQIETNMRNRINTALHLRHKKPKKTLYLLGVDSVQTLKEHIESRFLPGMSWENKKMWHIDHIIPIAFYDLKNEEQLLAAFNYLNLQPLWATENMRKNSRLPFSGTLIRRTRLVKE
ncbi:MAG: hypothetical protein Q7K40_01215 [bacterium]|nr:hypothetical protein [bacterium]